MPNLHLSTAAATTLDVDALVVGAISASDGPEPAPGSEDVDAASDGRLAEALRILGATGQQDEVVKLPSTDGAAADLLVVVGLGPEPPDGQGHEAETLRRAAGAAVRALAGTSRVALALPATDAVALGALAEGALLGAYDFDRYRDTAADTHRPPVGEVTLVSPVAADHAAAQAGARADTVSRAVTLARDLVNTPPSDLHPVEFADIAARIATEDGLALEILDEQALREGGYGGIIGVGQGSANPPRLVRLAHSHPDARQTLALAGKGITFDSGGLSLKPAGPMEWMKSDMGGAAAVLGVMSAIARLDLAVDVVGYLCLAENMPSGTAQRPSDVLTTHGGTTVEVLNTDAEGRLVLADALARAVGEADVVVDVATLTGAQITALGTRVAGVMANDEALRAATVEASRRAGEGMWPMPLPAELRKTLDSSVADIANVSGDRVAGMLTAGVFLREFVPDSLPWAHLDIAGPAFNQGEPYGYTPKGGTGVSVRTLVLLAEDAAAGRL